MKILKKSETDYIKTEWGSLTWYASKSLGNSMEMTTGICVIEPGKENPRHLHPDCEEVLYVQKGLIKHTYGEEAFQMGEGDAITVPAGVKHNAVNIGDSEAVLMIAFSSAERTTVGE